jgi:hypothetical protein
MTGNSLINLGELSKPATVLVEKISEAIGGFFEPYQIRRVARAEADADRIRASAAIEVSDLQRRALQRWIAEEAKRQDNIEAITAKALPNLVDTAEPERIEDDWITNFFDKSRLISDHEMQALWAQLLSGEANHPGTYSKRTVNYLASLDAGDAHLFTSLLGFALNFGFLQPVVLSVGHPLYAESGLNYSTLTHLDNIGLIRFDSMADILTSTQEKPAIVSYFDQKIELQIPHAAHQLPIGKVVLSKVGSELASVCNPKPVVGFLDYVLAEWGRGGVIASYPHPRQPYGG